MPEGKQSLTKERPFLTAIWRDLVMVTWSVDPSVLRPFLPRGCELDLWEDRALLSIVAFDFADVRVMGASIPFHRRFPEVNLRFYVRRRMPDGSIRRGVSFVQEIVPRFSIAFIARLLYGEAYVSRPMRSAAVPETAAYNADIGFQRSLVYEWKRRGEWERVIALVTSPFRVPRKGSIEDFIVDHEWGYTGHPRRPTTEYRVEHPQWSVSLNAECMFEAEIETLFGRSFVAPLDSPPVSTIVADGSEVAVYKGRTSE